MGIEEPLFGFFMDVEEDAELFPQRSELSPSAQSMSSSRANEHRALMGVENPFGDVQLVLLRDAAERTVAKPAAAQGSVDVVVGALSGRTGR